MGSKVFSAKGQSSSGATTSVGDATSSSQNFSAVSQRVELTDAEAVKSSFDFATNLTDKLTNAAANLVQSGQTFAKDSMYSATDSAERLRQEVTPQSERTQQLMLMALAVLAGLAIIKRVG